MLGLVLQDKIPTKAGLQPTLSRPQSLNLREGYLVLVLVHLFCKYSLRKPTPVKSWILGQCWT